MDVYLLRSSLVEEGAAHLSAEGRRIVRALGHKLKMTEEPSFDRLLSSPEPAALQTAELFAERTDYVGVVEALPLLVGRTPPEVIVPLLDARSAAGARAAGAASGQSPVGSVVIVADEPLLATIGAFLVGRPTFPPAVPAQVSLVRARRPEWFLRPGEIARQVLLVS